jgi:hypothetical protein
MHENDLFLLCFWLLVMHPKSRIEEECLIAQALRSSRKREEGDAAERMGNGQGNGLRRAVSGLRLGNTLASRRACARTAACICNPQRGSRLEHQGAVPTTTGLEL